MIYSYTFLNDYENCPRKARHRYVLKDLPREDSEALRWGNTVHSAMEHRVNKGTPLPNTMARFEKFILPLARYKPKAEVRMAIDAEGKPCDFFAGDAWLRGKLDITLQHEDVAYLFDWKTGTPREEPFELEVQSVLLKAAHPDLNHITGQYVWLKENRLGKAHDLSQPERYLDSIGETVEVIERNATVGHWPPRQNPLCNYCNVRSCEFNPKKAAL